MAYEEDWKQVVIKKVTKSNVVSVPKDTSSSSSGFKKTFGGNKNVNVLSKKQYSSLDSDDVSKPKTFSTTLGSKIAAARNEKGMTRKTFAQSLSSVSENDIAQVETGKMIFNQNLLNKINRSLGTSFTKND